MSCGLQVIQCVLEKFKEKKPAVVAALRDAADEAYFSVSLLYLYFFKNRSFQIMHWYSNASYDNDIFMFLNKYVS